MRILVTLLTLTAMVACTAATRNPVDPADLANPQVPGIEGARYWADVEPANINELLETSLRQRRSAGFSGPTTVLTLSGGAEDGAFAAGILNAWSEAGTRPEFQVVTGVSTGALAAPFAFLGSDYDHALRDLYGGLPPERIFARRSILSILPNASVKSVDPLKELIEEYLTDEFMEDIAIQHKRGRRLLIQSVSLDAQRPVLWDLGAIAASGAPNGKEVFRDALLASAAIPGVFPPVLIDVAGEAGVKDELHVDGGVISQSAFLPGWAIPTHYTRGARVYSIRNGKVAPEPETVGLGIVPVSKRSLATLIKLQGAQDLWNAYLLSKEQGGSFKATWIRTDFNETLEQSFDPKYMQALFQYGYNRFKMNDLWSSKPPRVGDI